MAVCRALSAVHDFSDHIGNEAVLCIIFHNIYYILCICINFRVYSVRTLN